MPRLVGFSRFAAARRADQRKHQPSHSLRQPRDDRVVEHQSRRPRRAAQSRKWPVMLKGKMEFRLGSEQRICGQADVVVIPGGAEHEAWFREDTEVIDFFAPPRDDFLIGGKPTCMSEG